MRLVACRKALTMICASYHNELQPTWLCVKDALVACHVCNEVPMGEHHSLGCSCRACSKSARLTGRQGIQQQLGRYSSSHCASGESQQQLRCSNQP